MPNAGSGGRPNPDAQRPRLSIHQTVEEEQACEMCMVEAYSRQVREMEASNPLNCIDWIEDETLVEPVEEDYCLCAGCRLNGPPPPR